MYLDTQDDRKYFYSFWVFHMLIGYNAIVISGHFLDQKRLKQGLYRHPWDDISYVLPEINN